MVSPSRRPYGQTGGMTTKSWLTWTLLLLYNTSASAKATPLETFNTPIVADGIHDPALSRRPQPGRSPAEIPILNHDVPTAKFRSTDEQIVEQYQALAPATENRAVRAPLAQSAESSGLAPLTPARLLQDWEADDIIILSTIDGSLHARDRRTGQQRWTLHMPESPMIEAVRFSQNRSNLDELAPQDDYMFIVEPSKEGQLYAQFTDPAKGLVRLPVTVKKMATETPLTMKFNGQYLATSSEQVTKVYTLDAETGEILHEFPKSRSSMQSAPQPRCLPRTGLDFEDSACNPSRTIRLGRNTYIFTISNEQTGQDLYMIKFSEWVINRGDNDLQSQHLSSLDGNDLRIFHNGRIIGVDESRHRYTHTLDCPVARVFDVVRPVDTQDDTSDVVLLSRPLDHVTGENTEKWRAELQQSQRVFVNRTDAGQWYVLSELSYPGVTSGAAFANTKWRTQDNYLDLQGDLKDIVGVHVLSSHEPLAKQRLTIGGPPVNSDLIPEQPKEIATNNLPETSTPKWKRYTDGFWGGLVALILCLLAYGMKEHQLRSNLQSNHKALAYASENSMQNVPKIPDSAAAAAAISSPSVDEKPLPEIPTEDKDTTPNHSRKPSSISISVSPKKISKTLSNEDNASEADSEEDEENGAEEVEQAPEGGKKKKKTKRGVRGGRGNKKKKAADPSFEPKPVVATEKHLSSGMVQVGRLTYDGNLDNCLGSGSNGTAVFPGTFDGRQVAVKRLVKTANTLAEKEIRHLVSSDENPHVIRYFGKEESPSFFYIALDRFTASLDQFVEIPDKYPSLISPTRGYDIKDALRQITRGVQHIHSLKLVHRDIKPQNILVRPVKTARPSPEGSLPQLLFVISDFGLCKPLEDGPDSVFAATRTAAGTTGWKAPELLVSSRDAIAAPSAESSHLSRSTTHSSDGTVIDPPSGRRATKAIDIFSLGCVFFYVMTRGGHPFDKGGSPLARDLNIKEDRFDTSLLRDSFNSYDYDADDLIMQMVKHNPRERPDTAGVLIHPYFWTTEQKLDFICAVSDGYEERKQKINNIHDEYAVRTPAELESLDELAALQSTAPDVIGTRRDGSTQDFLTALPRSFLNEMGKQRKYTGTKMIDLLRVIRNKKNHFHDLPNEVKEMMTQGGKVGPVEGYYGFWRERFPSLLVNLHLLIMDRDLIDGFGLSRFYDGNLNS